ncbi:hypothetical protein FRC11_004427 [Ceratobasidium sp. 423]|nr:hypothetical protein FRC11_004427 [Ceratobasidium sp. 423]
MSQNIADTASHPNGPVGIEELRKRISHAREEAQALGRDNPSHGLGFGFAASLLARAEGVLAPHPSSSIVAGLSSTPYGSTFTGASDSGSISTPSATRAPPSLSSSATPVNPTPVGVATKAGSPGAVTLNSYSEPAIPSDRLTFSYLWKLWALQNGKTQQDIPTLGGKFLDLQLLALNINSLGGQSEMHRDTSLWKRLAVQLKLIDSEARDDEHSKCIVDLLQKTQEELLLPFEQYCVAWSRLSEEERNKSLVEYATATKGTKANLPSPMPDAGDTLLPTSAAPDCGSALTLTRNSPEEIKLVGLYLYGFYPGVRLHTKIERLLKLPPSELPKYTWTRKRLNWLSKLSRNCAGMSTDSIIAYMAKFIPKYPAGQSPGKELIPPNGWPTNTVKVTEVLPPTSSAMFSPSLIVQANQFVERTLQAVEAVRPLKRMELPDAHQQPLRALVTEAYDLALFFYRAVALHYMLFLNEKDTRSAMVQAVLIIEQFFLSSTGYPAHIMNLEYAITSATRIRPRFALVFLWWFVTKAQHPKAAVAIAICGVIRTVACGGWVYITSSDDHDAHDVLMILYVVCNLPWMLGSISYTPQGYHASRKRRKIVASLFFGALPPMIYFFIRHKVQRIPGAYTHYSFFEWWLIVTDIAFDSLKSAEFSAVEISVRAVGSSSAEIEKYGKRSLTGSVPTHSLSTNPVRPKILPAVTQEKKINGSMANTTSLGRPGLVKSLFFSPVATYAADLYLSYCSWSVYTSLVIALFYFNIWELGVTGSELAVISTLTPFWLGIKSFRESVSSHTGQTVTRACVILGMAAYATDEPLGRLFIVAFANMALGIDWAITCSGLNTHVSPKDNSLIFAAGFILANLSKMANHSNNPVWPIVDSRSGGWNKTGLSLALLALAQFASRPPATAPQAVPKIDHSRTWMSGVGLGGTIFALYSLFADSGTIVAWSWTGYPAKGPIPSVMSGTVTISALCAGLALASSTSASRVVNHPAWLSVGAGACFVMYQYRDWVGYAAGLVYGLFLMSIFPKMLQESAFRGSALVYYLMWLTVIGLILADVWATAYAFVPGGMYMRERTDIVLTAEILAIGCGVLNWGKRTIGLAEAQSQSQSSGASSASAFAKLKSRIRATLGLIMVLAMSVALYRTPRSPPVPHHSGERLITAGIWTMHFGQDNEGRDSQRRMRDLIRDMELDVVGLLETDLHRTVFGHRDLTQVIAEELGYVSLLSLDLGLR